MQVDNQTHPKLLQKDKTQQKGKNVKISYKDCQVHHIPTILNGKIEVKNTGVKNEMNYKNGKNNTQDCKQHKVIMIGDSFIRGIRDNVEMSISDRFGIYSLLHPGGNLDTILHSAYKASENLTKKDLIYVCGGTNDFISDIEGPNVDSILEFMQSNKHTNVIFANVPLRYDLSYYSQINENIRTYNRKIRETIREHEQVTLMELNTERKNHTRHGLHFNKLGKWWLTHKIKKSIYTILGMKTEQSRTMESKQGPQEKRNKVEERDEIQECMEHNKKEHGRIVTQINKSTQEDKNERVCKNSDKNSGNDGGSHDIDIESVVVQNQVGGIDKNGEVRNNSMDLDKIQASSTNTQIEVVNKNMLIQEKNERVCENSDNKNVDDRACQNNESGVVHLQEYGERRSNSMDPDVAQTSSINTKCKTLDKIAETRRISTRNKKTPCMRDDDDFLY